MKTLAKIFSWIISQLAIATICWGIDQIMLSNLDLHLTWINWIGITTILSIIFPLNKFNGDKVDKSKVINIRDSIKF